MKILVTGAYGFVGRVLVRQLYQKHEVGVIDNLRFGENRFNAYDLSNVSFYRGDIRNVDFVKQKVKDFSPDVIVHLAAIHYIPECENDPNLAISTNLLGTINLLLACPRDCRFIFTSSGAVYEPSDIAHTEQAELGASDVYGLSKLQGEEYVKYFTQTRGLASVIVRLFNVIGPGETNPHVLPEIMAQLKAGRDVLRLGNIAPTRDFIDVRDVADGFAAVALNGEVKNGQSVTVNLASQRAVSVEHLINILRNVSGLDFIVETDIARFRKSDRLTMLADTKAISRTFGWTRSWQLEDTIKYTWHNPDLPLSLLAKYSS